MSITSRFKESRIGQFWLKYEEKIILVIGIILVAAVSFEAGFLEGQRNKQESIIVNKVACAPCPENEAVATNANSESKSSPSQTSQIKIDNQLPNDSQKCAFVASKNSNKYHFATCQFAQKIKPENKICFPSADEAITRGYQGAKCCIK